MDYLKYKACYSQYPVLKIWFDKIPDNLIRNCTILNLPRERKLFSRGDKSQFVYFICKGTVMISNMDDLGNEANVVFVQEGATVGEVEALLKRKDILFGAKAYTECVLLRMPVVDFDYIKATYSNFSNHLAEMLANKIYLSSINTIQYQQMEAITRLKRLLGNCEPGRVRQTRRELGDACGVSERTIQRVVKKMYEEGYLSLERGKIVLTEKQLDLIRKENRQKLSGF